MALAEARLLHSLVPATAGMTYVVSYHTDSGHHEIASGRLASPVDKAAAAAPLVLSNLSRKYIRPPVIVIGQLSLSSPGRHWASI